VAAGAQDQQGVLLQLPGRGDGVTLARSALATEGPHIDATDTAWLGRALAARYAYDLIVVAGQSRLDPTARCREYGPLVKTATTSICRWLRSRPTAVHAR